MLKIRGDMVNRFGMNSMLLASALLFPPLTLLGVGSVYADVGGNVSTLLKTKSCRGCDLQGANLNRADLAGADLEGASLAGAQLMLADLTGANLRNCNLQGAVFGGADLAGADLRGAQMSKKTLDGAYVAGAVFQQTEERVKNRQKTPVKENDDTLDVVSKAAKTTSFKETAETVVQEKVEVVEAEAEMDEPPRPKQQAVRPEKPVEREPAVSEGHLDKTVDESVVVQTDAGESENTQVSPAGKKPPVGHDQTASAAPEVAPQAVQKAAQAAEGLKIEKRDLVVDGKTATRARLLGSRQCYACDLSGIDFSGVSLNNSDLEKANLSGCNLSGANLGKSNLKGAVIRNADLRNADLRGADLYSADLSGSDLTGAKLEGAIFDDTELAGVTGMSR